MKKLLLGLFATYGFADSTETDLSKMLQEMSQIAKSKSKDTNSSSSTTTSTQNELKLKEQELKLKQKELELKDKEIELLKKQTNINAQESTINNFQPVLYPEKTQNSNPTNSSNKNMYISSSLYSGSFKFLIDDEEQELESNNMKAYSFKLGFGKFNDNRWEIGVSSFNFEGDKSVTFDVNYLWVWNTKYVNPYLGLGLSFAKLSFEDQNQKDPSGVGGTVEFGLFAQLNESIDLGIGFASMSHVYQVELCSRYYPSYSYCDTYDFALNSTMGKFTLNVRF